MVKYVLKTASLTKSYGNNTVLSDVSVELERGEIYGLIGQNGAGKSTFMRLITGLTFPTSGSIELFGHSGEKALMQERKRLGSMIEYPSLDLSMTAKENIRFHRIMKGIPELDIEDEVLRLVKLHDTGKKKAKNFSLGMKQRLGIAIALLGNPELLILDEPINGLDPIGVVEIRNLLKRICEERQITILISSHNLPEMYQTATHYIIIHKGEIRQQITLEELEEKCKHHIRISALDAEKLTSVLELKLKTTNYRVMPDQSIRLYDYINDKEKVARALFENGIIVTNFSNEGDTLEDYFVSVVGGAHNV
ncbi:ABC transporter ATP-binding protein [Clostridium felsineum]|uniref:ABC transporter ATP-binding protein n=1 Tax=Clostridium felsineum TaxID=36839 RepID=UPI00098C8F1F|nr:ABC transporter ATP-binding protein [Clostridium felsineum]URZ02539.1 Bacitracin transport ATP-binding protein BcrA [Clostridium felsineum]